MNELLENATTFPELRSITSTVAPIFWLPDAALVDDVSLDAILTDADREVARTLKAEHRLREHVRARYVIRRLCAWREALPRDTQGVITWPPGITGSISHKDGHVAVTLANTNTWRAVGLDIEHAARVRINLAPRIVSQSEMTLLEALRDHSARSTEEWLAVAFSFKEALFKSHYPLGRTMFYFPDAEIEKIEVRDETRGFITARIKRTTSPYTPGDSIWSGEYVWQRDGEDELIFTVVGVRT